MSVNLFFVERPFMLTGRPAPRPPKDPPRFGQPTYDYSPTELQKALISEEAHAPLSELCATFPTTGCPEYDAELTPYWNSVRWARAYRLNATALVDPKTAFVYVRGRLMREGVIFDQPPYQDIRRRALTWLMSLSWKTKRLKSGILLNTSRENNYYHLMHDFMTKIPFADDLEIAADVPLIVSEAWAKSVVGRQFLKSELFQSRPVVLHPQNRFLLCKELYVLQPPQNCGRLLRFVADGFEATEPADEVSPKLVLQRGDDVTHHRRCKGFDVLTAALVQRGYVAIDPARYTVSEQKWIFANASHIVAENGAAFGNLIFCDPKQVRIDALVTSKYATPTFQLLASALGICFTTHVVPSEVVGDEIHASILQDTVDAILHQASPKAR